MATKIRTYSKKNPVAALLKKPLAPVLDLDDELDAIMSCDGGSDGKKSSGTEKRKEKEALYGKENSPNVNKHAGNDDASTSKDKRPNKKSKSEPTPPTTPLKSPLRDSKVPATPKTPRTPKTPTKSPKPKGEAGTPTPKAQKTPTKSPNTPAKSPRTPKSPNTPTTPKTPKTPTKTPSPPKQSPNSGSSTQSDMRALKDELDYLLDGIDSPQSDIRRESMHRLAVECRKGMKSGSMGVLLRDEGGVEAQRLVDVLLLRWGSASSPPAHSKRQNQQKKSKDKSVVLCTAIILHALAFDPLNVPHLSRCLAPLRDIIFSPEYSACGDIIEKQTTTLINSCSCTNVSDDYNYMGNRSEHAIAAGMAIRAIASLSFTRPAISDALRQEGVVEGVTRLVSNWITKLVVPPVSASPEQLHSTIDMHSLLDIKYSLVILENATFVNVPNQKAILHSDCNIIDALLKLIVVARNIITTKHKKSTGDINMQDAAIDCMVGCLKLLLNLTYNDVDACDRVRVASVKNEYGNTNNTSNGDGLAIILSLLNLQFAEKEQFDIQQHILGLLINLVEISTQNRNAFGLIDGGIAKIVRLYVERVSHEEQQSGCGDGQQQPQHQQQQDSTSQLAYSNVGLVGAAYCAMLLGWLAYDSPTNISTITASLPDTQPLSSLATILKLFLSFQLQAGILAEDVHKSVTTAITCLESHTARAHTSQ